MTPQTIDLTLLRDIHLPVQPDFWPLAIGWWVIVAGVFTAGVVFFYAWYWHHFGAKGYAKRLLKKMYVSTPDTQQFALKISLLFKRIALSRFSREEVASLSGMAWARFLQHVGKTALSEQQAQFIAFATYAPPMKSVAFSNETLYNAANKWIDTVFKGNKNERK